jgi:DNA polymerase-4
VSDFSDWGSDRWILHIDLNAFYASVEEIRYPMLRNRPMAVCGDPEKRHGIVLAKNNLAKKAGVKTAQPLWEARLLSPDIVFLPADMESYIAYSRKAREIYYSYSDMFEPFGIDEGWLDVTGSVRLFGNGYEIAEKIRREIKEKLDLTVSIGVSYNKIFAKLGSDYKKPDATTVFSRKDFKSTVWEIDVSELLFVGRATTKKLNGMGIHTIGDLALCDRKIMESKFGKVGGQLWSYANGFDRSAVRTVGKEYDPIKSVGNSTTTPRDLLTNEEVKETLYMLSDSVASRLRDSGFRAQVIEIWLRGNDLNGFVRQRKIDSPTCLSRKIAETAYSLFLENYDLTRRLPLRSVGVRAKDLSPLYGETQTDLFMNEAMRMKLENLAFAVDRMRRKYGYYSIMTGIEMRDPSLPVISPEDSRKKGAGMYDLTPQR